MMRLRREFLARKHCCDPDGMKVEGWNFCHQFSHHSGETSWTVR